MLALSTSPASRPAPRRQNPAAYNMRLLRRGALPGASAFASARALAAFYAAVAEGRLFDAGRGAFARAAAPGALDGEPTRWALGMQVGTAGKGEQRAAVLGHRGMGGSVGLCVPQAGVAIAVTVSQLSARRDATRRLLAVALEACGGWSIVEDL
jgi:CubicO group peptidase (beta-lactamase class C family)